MLKDGFKKLHDIYLIDSNNTGLGLKGPNYTEVLFDQHIDWFINGKKVGGFLDQSVCETEKHEIYS